VASSTAPSSSRRGSSSSGKSAAIPQLWQTIRLPCRSSSSDKNNRRSMSREEWRSMWEATSWQPCPGQC
jgi:hypothetical protein